MRPTGYNMGFESPAHKPNTKSVDIIAADVLSEMVQRVAVEQRKHQEP